jgi:hypothetical protein
MSKHSTSVGSLPNFSWKQYESDKGSDSGRVSKIGLLI